MPHVPPNSLKTQTFKVPTSPAKKKVVTFTTIKKKLTFSKTCNRVLTSCLSRYYFHLYSSQTHCTSLPSTSMPSTAPHSSQTPIIGTSFSSRDAPTQTPLIYPKTPDLKGRHGSRFGRTLARKGSHFIPPPHKTSSTAVKTPSLNAPRFPQRALKPLQTTSPC